MPEIKHNFTGGKMNKDLDERIVPNGEYRHAMNIQIGTTDDSDIGVAQNILGNKMINIGNTNWETLKATTIGSISNPSNNSFYWFNKFASWVETYESQNATFDYQIVEPQFIIGSLGQGSNVLGDFVDSINTTWASHSYLSSAILELKNDTVTPVIQSNSVVFKMWDAVLGISQYDLVSQVYNTPDYSGGNGNQNVGGSHVSLINSYSYPDLTSSGSWGSISGFEGSEGFGFCGFGLEGSFTYNSVTYGPYYNGNKIEISDVTGVKIGMKVKGWGVDQGSGSVKNFLPEDLTVLKIEHNHWEHNGDMTSGFDIIGEPIPAQITLSKNIYNVGGNYNNKITHIEFEENTLGFQDVDFITGINIVGNELFWTDGSSVPKSINIEDGIIGSSDSDNNPIWDKNTNLVVNKIKLQQELTEDLLAVIKPAPLHAPKINLLAETSDDNRFFSFQIYQSGSITQSVYDPQTGEWGLIQIPLDQVVQGYDSNANPYYEGNLITLQFLTIDDNFANIPVGTLLGIRKGGEVGLEVTNPSAILEIYSYQGSGLHKVRIISIDETINETAVYAVSVQKQENILIEDIGRFCIRYKYKNNQYSPLGPWSEPAFLPSKFDIDTKEGVNIGMTNHVREIRLQELVPPSIREDVVGLDILYKDSSSPAVFKVDHIEKDNDPSSLWNAHYPKYFMWLTNTANGDLQKQGINFYNTPTYWRGLYRIKSKIKKSIIPEIQTLRPWDNVPKKALAQEIVGNRIVYGNYTQGYDMLDESGSKITLDLDITLQSYKNKINPQEQPFKSLKSFRNYQLGVVYSDRYGRSTPVLTTPESNFSLEIKKAAEFNELFASLKSDIPSWVDSYRFYVKGGEEEYYNLVQKGVYLSKEKDTWISFDSKDRNKITEEDDITLKVGGITNYDIGKIASYKVLSISNEVPESIKYFKVRTFYKQNVTNRANSVIRQDSLKIGHPVIILKNHTVASGAGGGASIIPPRYLNSTHIRFSFLESELDKEPVFFDYLEIESMHALGHIGSTDGARWEVILKDPLPSSYVDIIGEIEGNHTNVVVEMFEEKQIDDVQFEGRFFVKIGADQDFAVSFGGTSSVDTYAVSGTAKLCYYKDDLINADNSKYAATPVVTNTVTAGGLATCERPYNDTQEKWGQFLIDPSATNYSQGSNSDSTVFRSYTMDGHESPLNSTDVLSGWTDVSANNTTSLESVGRSLGAPTPGVWFLDDGDYIGSVINSNKTIERGQQAWISDGTHHGYHAPGSGYSYTNISANSGSNTAISDNIINISLGGCQAPYLTKLRVGGGGSNLRRISKDHSESLYYINENILLDGSFGTMPVNPKNNVSKVSRHKHVPEFANRLYPGNRLRWKEDPTQTVYTIQNVSYRTLLNYAVNDKMGSVTHDGVTTTGTFPAYFKYPHNFRHNWTIELDKKFDSGWCPVNSTPNSAITSNNDPISVTITSVPSDDRTFFLEDAGEDAFKLHDGMVLTHYHPNGGSNAAVTGDARIHSILHSEADGKTTVRLIKHDASSGTPSLDPCDTIEAGDVLTFQQYSMEGFSPFMAKRRLNVRSGLRSYTTEVTQFDAAYTPDMTPKTITYNLEVLSATTSIVKQISSSLKSYNYNVWETSPKELPDVDLFTEINDTYYPNHSSVKLENILRSGSEVYLATELYAPNNNTSTLDNNFNGTIPCVVSSDKPTICGASVFSDLFGWAEYENSNLAVSGSNNTWLNDETPSVVSWIKSSLVLSNEFTNDFILDSNDPNTETTISLSSNFPVINGGYTKLGKIKGDTIELLNANNTKTTATAGLLSLTTSNPGHEFAGPDILKVVDGDKITLLEVTQNVTNSNIVKVKFAKSNDYRKLNYFNCYSFGTGVESVSIGDEFNKQRLLNNGRISTTIETELKEENIFNGLIYSGIYNPASGINNLNQFIQADKITKEVNPTYGGIQRLFTRDSDLITFCEDKVLKILANKDALYNADGNTNLTASRNVLGQTIPFVGEYGISNNPESLASESYRLYFSDKQRGKILRLSRDGITPISDYGMDNWFKNNLKQSTSIIGGFDNNKNEYNVTINKETGSIVDEGNIGDSYTVTFSEKVKGWVSFKSFIPENSITLNNEYYSFNNGFPYIHHQKFLHDGTDDNFNYNTFYNVPHESEIEVILNDGASVVKSFLSLSYEGSQSKVDKFIEETQLTETNTNFTYSDNEHYNIETNKGWYVELIETDIEKGSLNEFMKKEGKWFNYIKGVDILEKINNQGQFIDPDNI